MQMRADRTRQQDAIAYAAAISIVLGYLVLAAIRPGLLGVLLHSLKLSIFSHVAF